MRTISQLIRERSEDSHVPFWVIEKDYALSYLLAAFSQYEPLGGLLILKGGTALRKAYFKDYRFSEDIDYSTRALGPIDQLDEHIAQVVNLAQDLLQEMGPFGVSHEREKLREPHPGEQGSFIIRVQFPYHRAPVCRLKTEITVDEPVLLDPVRFSILHDFPERMRGQVYSYALAEIAAEKLRALLQSRARIEERGWATSRVARDYYDLWYLLRNGDLEDHNLPDLVRRKAPVRGVVVESLDDFFDPSLLESARREWDQQLKVFVPEAPGADRVVDEARGLLQGLRN